MAKDGVSIAFRMILEEITSVEDQLRHEGALAFGQKRYSDARRLSESGERLADFRVKLEGLQTEWHGTVDLETRERVKVGPSTPISPHTKSPKTGLRVTLPNGRVLHEMTAARTFADTIVALGVERVRTLGLRMNGVPLIGTARHPTYGQWKHGSLYIMTHCNNRTKRQVLMDIGHRLGVGLTVELIG